MKFLGLEDEACMWKTLPVLLWSVEPDYSWACKPSIYLLYLSSSSLILCGLRATLF